MKKNLLVTSRSLDEFKGYCIQLLIESLVLQLQKWNPRQSASFNIEVKLF